MALKIFEKFSPRANPANTSYPYGSIKNESVPGAKDGTPLDASWGNDMLGFTDALLDEAGIVPSGVADTAIASQRLDAVKKVSSLQAAIQLIEQWGYTYKGTFANGFTYSQVGDAGVDSDFNVWIYVGAGAPNKVVTAGTVPSAPDYEQVTFNSLPAINVTNANGGNVQDYIDNADTNFHNDSFGSAFDNMKGLRIDGVSSAITVTDGDILSTGGTKWKVVSYTQEVELANGLFATPITEVNLLDFGADNTGVDLCNDAINDALDVSRRNGVFMPSGTYRVEGFKRRIRPGYNKYQESVVLYGVPNVSTVLHPFKAASTNIHGDGDIFLDVVNYSFKDIGVHNAPKNATTNEPLVPGKLFTLDNTGFEAGKFEGCYFQNADYHFFTDTVGGYILNLTFISCCFARATVCSRLITGQTPGYMELNCYTAHCISGLKLTQPGPSLLIKKSVYEYIYDYAIDIEAYGFADYFGITLEQVFFETCGGSSTVDIPGTTLPAKAQATPSIRLTQSQGVATGARFTEKDCFFTYTDTNKPTSYVYVDAAARWSVISEGTAYVYQPTGGVYSGSELSAVDAFEGTENTIRVTRNMVNPNFDKGADELLIPKSVSIGKKSNDAALNITKSDAAMLWLTNDTGSSAYMSFLAGGLNVRFGVSNSGGFLYSGTKEIVNFTHFGNAALTITEAGKGISLKSPDGLITRTLTIDNSGNIVLT